MPTCGSQIAICDMPLRFDNYIGCAHNCEYCFARRNKGDGFLEILPGESASDLERYIDGKRDIRTNWIDWELPVHWGGMSDGFQPVERERKSSLSALEVFAHSQYPVVISTKGALIAEDPWRETLSRCKAVVQVSIVAPSFSVYELGVPSFWKRIEMLKAIKDSCERTIARIQPLRLEVLQEVVEITLPALASSGVHGVIVECLKSRDQYPGLTDKLGSDKVYPYRKVEGALNVIKETAHGLGLAFYSGENRFRSMGDSLNCCGTDGVEGFAPNRCNLNHLFYGGYHASELQKAKGTADSFAAIPQSAGAHQMLKTVSFEECVQECAKARPLQEQLGACSVMIQESLF